MAREKHMAIRHVELVHLNDGARRILKDTRALETEAVKYISDVVMDHWDVFSALDAHSTILYAEKLIHRTKANPEPEYGDFDEKFHGMPCYIRRAVIQTAAGSVSSYKTRLSEYTDRRHEAVSNGRRFREKAPVFNYSGAAVTMYQGNAFRQNGKAVFLKGYKNKKWQWMEFAVSGRDIKCLEKIRPDLFKQYNPSVVYKNHKFYLTVPVEFRLHKFPSTELEKQTVLGVDLGINHGAVCSLVDFKGKVHSRAYDPFRRERKALGSMIARIRIIQRKSGINQKLSKAYQKLDGLKENYTRQLASWIVKQAVSKGAYGIVLERLGKMKCRGSRKDRIHHWCKAKIRDFVKSIAFRHGIRVFLINPRNTSTLAFDGSGAVTRDPHDFSKCTFTGGKRYDCDLSASYNIASRYFVRQYLINTEGSDLLEKLKAEVPELSKRTICTLSTLWKMQKCMTAKAA